MKKKIGIGISVEKDLKTQNGITLTRIFRLCDENLISAYEILGKKDSFSDNA